MPVRLARAGALLTLLAALTFVAPRVWAHCDGLDGPVVTAARDALQSGNINRVLIWVRGEDEARIRAAFNETMVVRKLGPKAQALADRYFFETLVRIHRAGEGASFTGLKPAGRDLGPAIPAADEAIESKSYAALERLLTEEMRHGLRTHFEAVIEKKDFSPDDVTAGRAYVEAYVAYIHYVERLWEAANRPSAGHYAEPDAQVD
jgi:hypothetical protein